MKYEAALTNKNLQAFLDTLSYSEGTYKVVENKRERLLGKQDSYRVRFPGVLFTLGKDHPRIVEKPVGFPKGSDAAGRYQFMSFTWDNLKGPLGITDFSPRSQDIACCELISRANALNLACEGHFDLAITRCNKTWASLPGSPYGQPTHSMIELRNYYYKVGGQIPMIE